MARIELMDSTPPAIPMSIWPDAIFAAIPAAASAEEAQYRLIVVQGTSGGRSESKSASRETLVPSAGALTIPK